LRILHAITCSVAAAVLGFLLLTPAALAADGEGTALNLPADRAAKPAQHVGPGGAGIVRTIVGLAVVLAVIYGLYWVLKQVKASKEAKASGAGLTPLATLPLGPNRSLHLVRAGDEIVLLGAGESGVTPIRTYKEPEARALGLLDDGDGGGPSPPGVAGLGAADGPPWRRLLDEIRRRTVIR
jgi:flagellar protein FliO/FliZ